MMTAAETTSKKLLTLDKQVAFLSIDGARYGFEHLAPFITDSFRPVAISDQSRFEIYAGDALDNCKLLIAWRTMRIIACYYSIRTRRPRGSTPAMRRTGHGPYT